MSITNLSACVGELAGGDVQIYHETISGTLGSSPYGFRSQVKVNLGMTFDVNKAAVIPLTHNCPNGICEGAMIEFTDIASDGTSNTVMVYMSGVRGNFSGDIQVIYGDGIKTEQVSVDHNISGSGTVVLNFQAPDDPSKTFLSRNSTGRLFSQATYGWVDYDPVSGSASVPWGQVSTTSNGRYTATQIEFL